MKTPGFWSSNNIISTFLLPAAWCYGAASTLRRRMIHPTTLPVPVICIGNLTAGGAGKTPVSLAIGERLKNTYGSVYFLSRGYGGSLQGPLLVSAKHTAQEVGDEPLLLAKTLPTVIAKDRLAGARFAIAQGAKAIIMDDGFQNPSIAKTRSLLVIDGQTGLGNGHLMPAGPLRETFAQGMRRADAVIVIGEGMIPATSKPVLRARIEPLPPAQELRGKKIIAFCGIGYPQKFFATLAALGAYTVDKMAFADHHPYTPDDAKMLEARAAKHGAMLVTTAKDRVRLPEALKEQVTVVEIALRFEDFATLDALLAP